jgi:hypothetical protein
MIPLDYDIIETAVPWWMVISCRNRWLLEYFVETGTSIGLTAVTASQHFRHVHTIELAPGPYNNPVPSLIEAANVTRYLGSSPLVIPTILPRLDKPTFWYLDAHWSGGGLKYGPECPLLDEIAAIGARDTSHDVIMIDNYGAFESCTSVHDPTQWPSVDQIVAHLHHHCPSLHASVFLDVFIACPSQWMRTFVNPSLTLGQ